MPLAFAAVNANTNSIRMCGRAAPLQSAPAGVDHRRSRRPAETSRAKFKGEAPRRFNLDMLAGDFHLGLAAAIQMHSLPPTRTSNSTECAGPDGSGCGCQVQGGFTETEGPGLSAEPLRLVEPSGIEPLTS